MARPRATPVPKNAEEQKTVSIRFYLSQIQCDPVQYKPQSPVWIPLGELYVDVPVPSDFVTSVGPEENDYVLTVSGYRYIVNHLNNYTINASLP